MDGANDKQGIFRVFGSNNSSISHIFIIPHIFNKVRPPPMSSKQGRPNPLTSFTHPSLKQ